MELPQRDGRPGGEGGARVRCRVCGSEPAPFGTACVLGKYVVRYYSCERCGFVQTEEPYWLDEAYSSAIAPADIGSMDRAVRMAEKTRALAVTLFDPWRPCLDFGAGYGLLVRRLRDLGLDFRYHDPHCENLFARGFEADPYGDERFELVTAFEVVEHLRDPVADVRRLLACTSSLFFSTELLPPHRPGPNDWWYYAPDTGQHISFFCPSSLNVLAEALGVRLLSVGNLHLLTRKRIPAALYSLLLRDGVAPAVGRLVARVRGMGSRLHGDYTHAARAPKRD